jgi:hypothetical protein
MASRPRVATWRLSLAAADNRNADNRNKEN